MIQGISSLIIKSDYKINLRWIDVWKRNWCNSIIECVCTSIIYCCDIWINVKKRDILIIKNLYKAVVEYFENKHIL